MIELTDEQLLVLQAAAETPPAVLNPRTQDVYVLLRREVYERIRSLVENDVTAEDAFQAQIESAAAAGWDDPALDVYNNLETGKS